MSSAQETLTESAFFDLLRSQNPIARTAALRPAVAGAELMAARGAFDPKFYTDFSHKSFDGSEYYSILDGGLKMRLPFSPELNLGYERATGINVDPETTVPTNGLLYGGVSVPLLRNLMFDNQRAALRSARVLQENAEAEQVAILNDLFFESGYAYWNWFRAFHQLEIQREGLGLANALFEATEGAFELGDKAAIDTVEAGVNRQARRQELQASELELQSAELALLAYVFSENTVQNGALDAQPIKTESLDYQSVVQVLQQSWSNPEIRMAENKVRLLEIERRAKQEQIKPRIDLKFNPLYAPDYDAKNPAVFNNFKFGLTAGTSLLLRKERAGVRLADLKLQDAQFQLQQKRRNVEAKVATYRQQISLYQAQIQSLEQMTAQYLQLIDGEQEKFNNGESSIFLVNYRQSAYLLAKSKLLDVQTKYAQSVLGLRWAMGILGR